MISWWSFLERGVVDAISTVYHLVPTTASPTFWISWWSLECLESKSVHKFGLSPLQPPRSLGAFWGHFERVNEQWKSRQELDGIFCSIFTSLALQAVQLMDYAWNLQFRVDPSLVSYGHAVWCLGASDMLSYYTVAIQVQQVKYMKHECFVLVPKVIKLGRSTISITSWTG